MLNKKNIRIIFFCLLTILSSTLASPTPTPRPGPTQQWEEYNNLQSRDLDSEEHYLHFISRLLLRVNFIKEIIVKKYPQILPVNLVGKMYEYAHNLSVLEKKNFEIEYSKYEDNHFTEKFAEEIARFAQMSKERKQMEMAEYNFDLTFILKIKLSSLIENPQNQTNKFNLDPEEIFFLHFWPNMPGNEEIKANFEKEKNLATGRSYLPLLPYENLPGVNDENRQNRNGHVPGNNSIQNGPKRILKF